MSDKSRQHLSSNLNDESSGWLLPRDRVNNIQAQDLNELITRARKAHFVNVMVRINGKDETYEADWLKHLHRCEPPSGPFELSFMERNLISKEPAHWRVLDRETQNVIARCFDSDNARMVRDALNALSAAPAPNIDSKDITAPAQPEGAAEKPRASDGRAVNGKGVPFADVLAAMLRGEYLDPIDVIDAQRWRIDNQRREIASLRKQLTAARGLTGASQQSETKPLRPPGDCKHERADMKCTDCGIDLRALTHTNSLALVLACLELKDGSSFAVQVKEGLSDPFWYALANAFEAQSSALKAKEP